MAKTSKTAEAIDITALIHMADDERVRRLKKMSKDDWVATVTKLVAKLIKERNDFVKQWQDWDVGQKRVLEQNQELADDNNRLRNENDELRKMVAAAVAARNAHMEMFHAATVAAKADLALAGLGAPVSTE